MSVSPSELRIGIVGAGGFAAFAARAFRSVEGVTIVAVADSNPMAASQLADDYAARAYTVYEVFLKDTNVDVVYIATPPALHYGQSKAALLAGKHLICEKPAALAVHEAEELVQLASNKGLLYVVNLMQRYNPLCQSVGKLIEENALGEFTHGFFENCASDEALSEEHWFWDDSISGGIFIEHGVHFFDLFASWLGKGELVYSAKWKRPAINGTIYDRVQAIVNYDKGPVSYYHGFDQPKILDRQEIRLQFERGDITLYGWVPVRVKITGLFREEQIEKLKLKFPGCVTVIRDTYQTVPKQSRSLEASGASPPEPHGARGRFKGISFDHLITMECGKDSDKLHTYEQLLKDMIKNQWDWILNSSVARPVNGQNAVESLRVAAQATTFAKCY